MHEQSVADLFEFGRLGNVAFRFLLVCTRMLERRFMVDMYMDFCKI